MQKSTKTILFSTIGLLFLFTSASNTKNLIDSDKQIFDYSFHESVQIETAYDEGRKVEYVYFGDYPQTIKADSVTIDESQSEIHGAFTYYKGSDGCWYCKLIENGYEYTGGQEYSDHTGVKTHKANSLKYFKVEPIKWRVLTRNYNNTNQALLFCESIIDISNNTSAYCYRLIDDKLVYANNYKESEVRAFLNGLSYNTLKDVSIYDKYKDYSDFLKFVDSLSDEEKKLHHSDDEYLNKGFLQTAFTKNAQQLISVTEVDNSMASKIHYPAERLPPWNTKRDDYFCENTFDKIFLLSEYEITGSDFSFGTLNDTRIANIRILPATDFARARGLYDYRQSGKHVTFWWLRTPMDGDWRIIRFVEYQGCSADNMGGSGGVVPALCIPLE